MKVTDTDIFSINPKWGWCYFNDWPFTPMLTWYLGILQCYLYLHSCFAPTFPVEFTILNYSVCLNSPDHWLVNSSFFKLASIVSEIASILHSSSRSSIHGLSLWERNKNEQFYLPVSWFKLWIPKPGADIMTTRPHSPLFYLVFCLNA